MLVFRPVLGRDSKLTSFAGLPGSIAGTLPCIECPIAAESRAVVAPGMQSTVDLVG
jgi:hypothetical protein